VAAAARQATVPVTVVVVLDACTDRPEDAIARPVRADAYWRVGGVSATARW
jgi:hypothetical protein